jgi:hypothetical protein
MIVKCGYGVYERVEVCGGVCEAAEGCIHKLCGNNHTGTQAYLIFKLACDKEYGGDEQ